MYEYEIIESGCLDRALIFRLFRYSLDILKCRKGVKVSTFSFHENFKFLYLISGPISSAFVKKFGARKVAVFGSFMAAAGLFLCTFSTNLDLMIFLYGGIAGKCYMYKISRHISDIQIVSIFNPGVIDHMSLLSDTCIICIFLFLRWYLTLQGDNSVKLIL